MLLETIGGVRVPKFNRWVSLICGMFMMLISGTIYLFPGYSDRLKALLGYSVEQIDFVGTLLNAGTWAGVLGGLFYDKYGPRLATIIAAVMIFIGYFTMYLGAAGTINNNYLLMAFFAFVVGQGSGWIYTAALNTNTANFTKEDRGKVMGLLTCCFGLCSGMFTLIMKSFYPTDVASFFLFLSICLPIVAAVNGFIFTNFLSEYPKLYRPQRLYIAFGIMLLVALWISVASLVTNFTSVGPIAFCAVMLGIIGCLAFVPLLTTEGLVLAPSIAPQSDTEGLLDPEDDCTQSVLGEEYNLWRAIRTIEFWLLFFTHFAIIGAGITLLNNLNEIVISREYPATLHEIFDDPTDLPHAKYAITFVIIFSVCNTLGRLTVGLLSDKFVHKLSRPVWLCIVACLMTVTQVYFLIASIPFLFGGVVILGLAYGGAFSVVPTLTCEIFGMKYFGANFGFVGIAPALGSELVSTLLAGKLNDYFKQTDYITIGNNNHCFGSVCFKYTLIITFALCLCAIVSSFLLKWRCNKKPHTPQTHEKTPINKYSPLE